MNKVLVIIDMQNDFISEPLGTPEAQKIVPKLCDWIATVPYDEYICTLDTHNEHYLETPEGKKLPIKHCLYQSEGWIHPKELDDALIFKYPVEKKTKKTFGTFKWQELDLYKEEELVIDIVGVCTDICVITNALILKTRYPNATIRVISHLCAGTTPEKHKEALNIMESCQVDIL